MQITTENIWNCPTFKIVLSVIKYYHILTLQKILHNMFPDQPEEILKRQFGLALSNGCFSVHFYRSPNYCKLHFFLGIYSGLGLYRKRSRTLVWIKEKGASFNMEQYRRMKLRHIMNCSMKVIRFHFPAHTQALSAEKNKTWQTPVIFSTKVQKVRVRNM